MRRIVIIGNGIAGITAARHLRKWGDDAITVISGETSSFFSRTALMYVYMGQLRFRDIQPYPDSFWTQNRIDRVQAWVNRVNVHEHELWLDNGQVVAYDLLILATGSRSVKLNVPGAELEGVQGLYFKQDLERMEARTQDTSHAVVIGGGLIGVELAEMLHSRDIQVTYLIRESRFWKQVLSAGEAGMVEKHMRGKGIAVHFDTEVKAFHGREGVLREVETSRGEKIACGFAGVAIGVEPNVNWLHGSGIEVDKGILINERFETNLPGIYAIGDCVQHRYPPAGRSSVEQVWYTGREMGKTLARILNEKEEKYAPGPWFNSAKFFGLEFQTYGAIPETSTNDVHLFEWVNASSECSLRIAYASSGQKVMGIQSIGMRLRMDVCLRWIETGASLGQAVSEWKDASFDPEFSKDHTMAWMAQLQSQTGLQVTPQQKNWKRIMNAIRR
ncbi:MAG: NAD(P)/FAD-dependent oxidoreductase [Flavobacteriales bacterium]|nr:NAD(P)/FAD-dependent oxidoreductase [Flavobacteriales bacterium]MCB9448155.1 NAD(P)/FAD-dependent oxidoreductase [Flavobacteriales bacterium]